MPRDLESLKREALKSCRVRGHTMAPWIERKASGEKHPRAYSICEVCGKGVLVLTRPAPNEIDIGGAAVAVGCSDDNPRPYQPKTGARCSCKPGVQRDNCPSCEGTGMLIDFRAIRGTGELHVQPDRVNIRDRFERLRGTINGHPAKIVGLALSFAHVVSTDGSGINVEYAWETLQRIVDTGRVDLRTNPTHDNPPIFWRLYLDGRYIGSFQSENAAWGHAQRSEHPSSRFTVRSDEDPGARLNPRRNPRPAPEGAFFDEGYGMGQESFDPSQIEEHEWDTIERGNAGEIASEILDNWRQMAGTIYYDETVSDEQLAEWENGFIEGFTKAAESGRR